MRDAKRTLHTSGRITADQIDDCVGAARQRFFTEGPISIGGDFEIDGARVDHEPQLHIYVQAPVYIGRSADSGPVFGRARLRHP